MDVSRPEISYLFLVIPAFFALTVLFQGLGKLSREEEDAPIAVGFGVVLLILIGAAYWWLIR